MPPSQKSAALQRAVAPRGTARSPVAGMQMLTAMNLELRRLRSFINIAELKSFRRASEKLHISPPALSAHIRQLERAFKVRLFERTTRKVVLTPEGKRAFVHSRDIISKFDKIIDRVREKAASQREELTVACIPTFMESVMPRVVKVVAEKFPRIQLHIIDGGSQDVLSHVESGEATLAIAAMPERRDSNFEITPLVDEAFGVIVPKGHPLARLSRVEFRDLAKYPFIKFTGSRSLAAAIDSAERASQIALSPVLELAKYGSVTGLVQAGMGITILPMPTASHKLRGLSCVPISGPGMLRHICLIRRKRENPSNATLQFLGVVAAVIKQMKFKAVYTQSPVLSRAKAGIANPLA